MFVRPVEAVYDIAKNPNNPLKQFDSVAAIVNVILPTMYIVGAFIFLAMLVYGAFTFLTSGGDAEKVAKARKTITYTVIGLLVVVTAVLIVNLISFILDTPSLPI